MKFKEKYKKILWNINPSLFVFVKRLYVVVIMKKLYLFFPYEIYKSIINFRIFKDSDGDYSNINSWAGFEPDKTWLVVASGPSLNEVDLGSVKGCNVILVNKSYELYGKLKDNNNVLSFFTDTYVFNEHYKYMDPALKFSVVLTKFNLDSGAACFLKKYGLPILPKISSVFIRNKSFGIDLVYGLYKHKYKRLRSGYKGFWANRRTVTLTAVYVAAICGGKQIYTIGFDGGAKSNKNDMNPNDSGYYSDHLTIGPSRKWVWEGWGDKERKAIDLWALDVKRYCLSVDAMVRNWSPHTFLKTFDVVEEKPDDIN